MTQEHKFQLLIKILLRNILRKFYQKIPKLKQGLPEVIAGNGEPFKLLAVKLPIRINKTREC